jgi:hypothetical protein
MQRLGDCGECSVARICGGYESTAHSRDIGSNAGEESEGLSRLVYAHSSTAEDTSTFRASGQNEFGFEWRVDHVHDPVS